MVKKYDFRNSKIKNSNIVIHSSKSNNIIKQPIPFIKKSWQDNPIKFIIISVLIILIASFITFKLGWTNMGNENDKIEVDFTKADISNSNIPINSPNSFNIVGDIIVNNNQIPEPNILSKASYVNRFEEGVYLSKFEIKVDSIYEIETLDIIFDTPDIISINAMIFDGILQTSQGKIIKELPQFPSIPVGTPVLRIRNARGVYDITLKTKKPLLNNLSINYLIP